MDRQQRFEALTSVPEAAAIRLGEVLVTEARVSIAGCEGRGMVLGRSPDHALSVAVVDAGLEAGHAERTAIERDLAGLAMDAAKRAAEAWVRVAPTRVQFDVF